MQKECKTQLMLALVCGGKLPDISRAVYVRTDSVGSYRKKLVGNRTQGGPRVFGMVARARTFLRAAINLVPVSKRQRMAEIVVIFPRRGVIDPKA